MFKFDPGVTLDQLVRANEVGAVLGDLMAILEALREAGALQGQLIAIQVMPRTCLPIFKANFNKRER